MPAQSMTLTWGLSARDRLVHAFAGEQWCGDEIALCQHTCPPAHVLCTWRGQATRCRTCQQYAGA